MKFAVLVQRSIFIPGDERSRTNPGHGYGETTVLATDVIELADERALVDWVKQNDERVASVKYRAIRYDELTIGRTVEYCVQVTPK